MKIPLRQYVELLGTYLRPQWRKMSLLSILIFGSIGLQLINPQIVRYFIDTALADGAWERLIYAAVFFLGSALLLQVATVSATYVGEDVGWTATNALRADLALHCLRLDMSFHNERTPGQMIERIDGDVANLAIFFAQFLVRVLASLLLLVGVLVVLLFEDWRISLALAMYSIVAVGALVLMRRVAVPHWKASREASADLFGFLEEQLAGTEDVRSSGATGYVMRNLFKFNRIRLQKERKAGSMNVLMIMMWFGLFTLGQIVAFLCGFYLFRAGLLTIGTVYLLISYTDAIFQPLRDLTEQIQNLQKAVASIERIQELYHTQSKIPDGNATLPAGALAVTFERVSFGYQEEQRTESEEQRTENKEQWAENQELVFVDGQVALSNPKSKRPEGTRNLKSAVVHDLSFALPPGTVLGLLGRTGSGKTTMTRLLFRLYDPHSGSIRLGDGMMQLDLRDARIDDLRRRVGIVTQDVQLFRATVRDNLTFFDQRNISDPMILEMLGELGLTGWYRALPDGLHTKLEGGAGLSAGEAQLLAFTRVFLKDPGLVILDEASSRLDPATEQLIEHAMDKLLEGRTGIIVAHRLATVHRADYIMILEDGHILEFGAYDDLVSDPNSRFYRLLQTGLEEVLA